MSLLELPSEILGYIHLLAQTPSLPLVHSRLRWALSSAPAPFVARYLYSVHDKDLNRCARYPVCTIPVIQELERSYGPLSCEELPRRLFRQQAGIHPMIRYLFDNYKPSANSHKGYPLCRAILLRNYELVEFLLSHGADPAIRGHLAVQVAIQICDVKIVRMLLQGRAVEAEFIKWALKGKDEAIVGYLVTERGMMPRLKSILGMKRKNAG